MSPSLCPHRSQSPSGKTVCRTKILREGNFPLGSAELWFQEDGPKPTISFSPLVVWPQGRGHSCGSTWQSTVISSFLAKWPEKEKPHGIAMYWRTWGHGAGDSLGKEIPQNTYGLTPKLTHKLACVDLILNRLLKTLETELSVFQNGHRGVHTPDTCK